MSDGKLETGYHLFLCPQNADGRPVKISNPPRTPNAGSSLVAILMGAGVGVALGLGLMDGEIVAVCVDVALTIVDITVVIGTFRFPDRLTRVVV